MNHHWAICIGKEDAGSLAPLRHVPGVEVAAVGQNVWLRGKAGDESLAVRLSTLPAIERYEWLVPDRLRPLDHRIPSGQLPAVAWQPLSEWLQVQIPVAALPASLSATVPLRLVRSAEEREPGLLLTTVQEFQRFTAQAAQIRIECLRFAASADGRALVQGTPLPSLPGRRFVLYDGVAVPAGFAWEPAVSKEVVNRRFGASHGTLVLWDEDGTITRLHAEQWIPATRSAVRATAEALAGDR